MVSVNENFNDQAGYFAPSDRCYRKQFIQNIFYPMLKIHFLKTQSQFTLHFNLSNILDNNVFYISQWNVDGFSSFPFFTLVFSQINIIKIKFIVFFLNTIIPNFVTNYWKIQYKIQDKLHINFVNLVKNLLFLFTLNQFSKL